MHARPTVSQFNAASVNDIMHDAHHFGYSVGETKFDWNALKTARDSYIARLNGIYARNMANNKVEVITGFGAFSGPNEVTVGADKFTAEHILIAVGGKPFLPNIPGIEHCISSDGFFALDKQPRSVAVIGGGYIGVELAGVFHSLGTKTDWFVRENQPLKNFDDLIVTTLLSESKKHGLMLHTFQTPTEVRKNADSTLTLVTAGGQEWGPYDQVLFATGRTPLTGG
jgi:glutathione reductase (NADPH)